MLVWNVGEGSQKHWMLIPRWALFSTVSIVTALARSNGKVWSRAILVGAQMMQLLAAPDETSILTSKAVYKVEL